MKVSNVRTQGLNTLTTLIMKYCWLLDELDKQWCSFVNEDMQYCQYSEKAEQKQEEVKDLKTLTDMKVPMFSFTNGISWPILKDCLLETTSHSDCKLKKSAGAIWNGAATCWVLAVAFCKTSNAINFNQNVNQNNNTCTIWLQMVQICMSILNIQSKLYD